MKIYLKKEVKDSRIVICKECQVVEDKPENTHK